MSFVHGHARDITWVKSHRRAPNRPEQGQLPLTAGGPKPDGDDATMVGSEGRPEADTAGAVDSTPLEPALPRPRTSLESEEQAVSARHR